MDTGEKGFPKFSTLEKVSIASRYSSGLIDEEENLTCKWCYGVLVNARSDMMAFGVILNTYLHSKHSCFKNHKLF